MKLTFEAHRSFFWTWFVRLNRGRMLLNFVRSSYICPYVSEQSLKASFHGLDVQTMSRKSSSGLRRSIFMHAFVVQTFVLCTLKKQVTLISQYHVH